MKYQPLISDRFFHVYNRGNNRENLFVEERNYEYFLQLMFKHLLPVAEIYSYCLLKNHFHLLVRMRSIENSKLISRGFSNLFNAYAKAINKSYNRTGSLFQDRFARIMVEDEKYLRNLILYIHLNPKKHKFVEDFRSYKFSSYQSLISFESCKLEKEKIINLFGDRKNFIRVHINQQENINLPNLTGLGDL